MGLTEPQRAVMNAIGVAPWMSVVVGGLTLMTPMRDASMLNRALAGGLTAGSIAAIWEYTVNNSKDSAPMKWEVISGVTVIGAGTSAIAPIIM